MAVKLTQRRIRAACAAVHAVLSGDGKVEGVTHEDLVGAHAALLSMHDGVPPAAPTRWRYHSANLSGNLHEAAILISKKHPDWDVVAMETVGNYTVVVWREEIA